MRSDFLKHVLTLAGGTAMAQGLLLLASPLLTRLYDPDDFGLLAVFMALQAVLLVGVALRYEMAIPLPKTLAKAANLLGLALSLAVINGLLLLALLALGLGDWLAQLIDKPDFADYLWLLPLSLVGAGLFQAANLWASREHLFSLISTTKMQQSVVQLSLQLGWGWLAPSALGLLLGFVLSSWVGVWRLLRRSTDFLSHWQPRNWWALSKEYHHFPLYTLWASLLNVMSWQVPPLFLAAWFSLEAAGWYALTIRVLAAPSALIGQAVAQVFYPKAAASEADPQANAALVANLSYGLLATSLPLFLLVALQGDWLFALIFGEEWRQAGVYAQWLTPWFVLGFVSSPLSSFALVKSRQRSAFFFTLYEIVLRVTALGIGVWLNSIAWAIGLYALAGVIIASVYILWIWQLAGLSYAKMLHRLTPLLLLGLLLGASLFALGQFISPWLALALNCAVLAGFGWWAWQRRDQFSSNLTGF